MLICATGFDTTFRYPFRVVGRSGQTLSERWGDRDVAPPAAYLSLAVDGFPNLFICGGPNSAVTSGSQVNIAEHVAGYVVEAVRKMQRERLRSMEVRREALEDWSTHVRVRLRFSFTIVGVFFLLTRAKEYFPKVRSQHELPCADAEGSVSVFLDDIY